MSSPGLVNTLITVVTVTFLKLDNILNFKTRLVHIS